MSNNWSYKFRTASSHSNTKMVRVVLKTKEVIMLQASLLSTYINKHHTEVFTYQFV